MNGLTEQQHATSDQYSHEAPVRESNQPLNSTPNQKSSMDGSSLPTLLSVGIQDSTNAAMLNGGSLPNYLTPSPIPKSGRSGGMVRGDLLATPGSKENSSVFQTSGERLASKHGEGSNSRHNSASRGSLELDNLMVAKENGRGGGGGGSGLGQVFSGASQGGVLVDHMRYLPPVGSGTSSEAMARVGAGTGGGGVVEAGGIGYRDTRFTTMRDRLAGRYALEEEITELEQKVKVSALRDFCLCY